MPPLVRTLTSDDTAPLVAYAEEHMGYLGFLAGTVLRYGIEDLGKEYHGTYVGALHIRGGFRGVAVWYNRGNMGVFAEDEDTARLLAEAAVELRGLPQRLIGKEDSARAALSVLALHGAATDDHERYRAMELHPQNFTRHDAPGIRRATEDDIPALARMMAASFAEQFGTPADPEGHERELTEFFAHVRPYVVDADGAPVGMCLAWGVTERAAEVGGTYVAPEYRGAGLGTAVMSALCADLLPGRRCLALMAREDNGAALRCYEKLGFAAVGPVLLARLAEGGYW